VLLDAEPSLLSLPPGPILSAMRAGLAAATEPSFGHRSASVHTSSTLRGVLCMAVVSIDATRAFTDGRHRLSESRACTTAPPVGLDPNGSVRATACYGTS